MCVCVRKSSAIMAVMSYPHNSCLPLIRRLCPSVVFLRRSLAVGLHAASPSDPISSHCRRRQPLGTQVFRVVRQSLAIARHRPVGNVDVLPALHSQNCLVLRVRVGGAMETRGAQGGGALCLRVYRHCSAALSSGENVTLLLHCFVFCFIRFIYF